MKHGNTVRAFEQAFSQYVGSRYAIACCNGTATMHTALVAMGVQPGDRVAVPPLTMSATTIAVLHAGAVPVFVDVDPDTWLMGRRDNGGVRGMTVSLYGLHARGPTIWIDDAAQTLRPMNRGTIFTSYSFQASKILALGEGGMLITDNPELATRARSFASLGYAMPADQPRIDPHALKDPAFMRHHRLGHNYRMNDLTAAEGLRCLPHADRLLQDRRMAAGFYRDAITGCDWVTPQDVPEGYTHDYWCYAFALASADLWAPFVAAIERHGGERPYAAWKLTYQEPAFRHLAEDGCCPVAESLQLRLVQCQTNRIRQAVVNADAVHLAIRELDG